MDQDTTQTTPGEEKQEKHDASAEAPKEIVREIHHHHYAEKRRGWFFARFFWGLFIIFFGLLFLAFNAGWLPGLNIGEVFGRLWPVLIVFLGLSVLSRGGWLSAIIGVVVTLVVFGFLAYVIWSGAAQNYNIETKTFSLARETAAKTGEVQIKAGRGKIQISGGSEGLVSGKLESGIADLETESTYTDGVQKASVETKSDYAGFGRNFVNILDVKLNSTLPLSLMISAGASSMNVDLSDVVVEKLSIDTGATSLDLLLGDKAKNSKVEISAGVSSVNVTLPRTVGAKITSDGGLSSKNFSDFTKQGDKTYESENYSSASKKIDISIDAGVSSINVGWK